MFSGSEEFREMRHKQFHGQVQSDFWSWFGSLQLLIATSMKSKDSASEGDQKMVRNINWTNQLFGKFRMLLSVKEKPLTTSRQFRHTLEEVDVSLPKSAIKRFYSKVQSTANIQEQEGIDFDWKHLFKKASKILESGSLDGWNQDKLDKLWGSWLRRIFIIVFILLL